MASNVDHVPRHSAGAEPCRLHATAASTTPAAAVVHVPIVLRGIGRGWDLGLAGYPLSAPGERQYDEEHSEPSAPVHRFLRTARPSWPISEPGMSLDQARVIVFTSSTLSLRNTACHHQRKNTMDMYNNFSDLTGQLQDKPRRSG